LHKYKYMHMTIRKTLFIAAIIITFANATMVAFGQATEPWTAKDLIEPAALANMISGSGGQKPPVILNIGPLADIKGAVHVGAVNTASGLNKLKMTLANVPKDKMVVIYCGCCPFRNCPNIRPAFKMLKEQGYTNPKLLNLKQNLKVDWTDYGYPMN
jgi:thiosulfate/3-mercaptopyruvate sulfurtransferase